MKKRLLFSLTRKDFSVQTFKSGGKGGQHQNTTDSGVRILHATSGAVGECREQRSQHANKKIAFKRLTETKTFKTWHKIKCAELMNMKTIDKEVAEMMQRKNLLIEIKDKEGKWVIDSKN